MHHRPRFARRRLRRTSALGVAAFFATVALVTLLVAEGAIAGEVSPPSTSAGRAPGSVRAAATASRAFGDPMGLTITGFAVSPTVVVVGSPTYFNVSTDGGAEPLSFHYGGLPYPCVSSNTPSLLCRPAEVRNFTVTVSVTDADGARASRAAELDVLNGYYGPPSFVSFYARPAVLRAGAITYLWANATSPSEPAFLLAFTYFDLPAGCTSFNQTPLECLAMAPGNYTIGVRVTDAFGQAAIAYSTLIVTGSPGAADAGRSVPVWQASAAAGVLIVASTAGALLLLRRGQRRRGV